MRGRIQRRNVIRALRQVKRERSMIAEAVEGASAGDAADELAILALVEERAGLLAPPWCREVANGAFMYLDLVGDGAVQQLDVGAQSLLGAEGNIIASEDAFRCELSAQRFDDVRAELLESGAHELYDEPSVIAVDDERGEQVALPMDEAVCVGACVETAASC